VGSVLPEAWECVVAEVVFSLHGIGCSAGAGFFSDFLIFIDLQTIVRDVQPMNGSAQITARLSLLKI
jgi:hypothetical protein